MALRFPCIRASFQKHRVGAITKAVVPRVYKLSLTQEEKFLRVTSQQDSWPKT